MEFKKKLKARLYTAIVYTVIGIAFICVSIAGVVKNEFLSSFGAMFVVIGIARIIQYMRITRDEESIRKREVEETDERNVMIYTKARSLTFTIYIMLAAAAVVVLHLLNLRLAEQIVAYTLCGFVSIYWICYFIMSRKY